MCAHNKPISVLGHFRLRPILGMAIVAAGLCSDLVGAQSSQTIDPAGWGSDHVGKALPDYVTGGECLFCHRYDIGNKWQGNRHNVTMREASPDLPAIKALSSNVPLKDLAAEVTLVLGGANRQRFLKPNGRYGQVAILSTEFLPGNDVKEGVLSKMGKSSWDNDKFGNRCAGCHATGVDGKLKAFSSISHDCFACHGLVPQEHSADTSQVLWSKTNKAEARVHMSICASCHLRSGTAKSTGRPYPNQFVSGDNLFRDFEVDFSDGALERLNPGDRHVLANVRDVVVSGRDDMTCATCHDIHAQSSRKHRTLKRLQRDEYCGICHTDKEDYKKFLVYEVHSETCEY